MPVTADKPAPYAPASAIIELIERHRNKGLPNPVDSAVLERAGISASLIPRTLQALYTLDLLTDDGKPSPVLEGIRLAPEAEYKQRLVEWLNSAYADALAYVDPSKDDETGIRDAFRGYSPVGQQSRMVTLFIGLFAAAGVMPDRQKPPPKKQQGLASPKLRVSVKSPRHKPDVSGADRTPQFQSGLPPALAGLLASLPATGNSWTQADRDRFITTFGAVLDFCFSIDAKPKQVREQDIEADDEE